MDIRKILKDIAWIKPWPTVRERGAGAARALVAAAAGEPPAAAAALDDVIAASKRFPLRFPIDTVRLEKLKLRIPAERLQSNIESTYPIMHERVVWLIADFLLYKRKYGSNIEKNLYKDMTIAGFVDRLMRQRAATFMKAQDQYKLLSGKQGTDGWESVGTDGETPPLLLRDCLSYDEMKISALVYVSGHTECVNDGARKNAGVLKEDGVEPHAVIIGIVGPRFKRINRMEYEDILVTPEQNTPQNGYGRAAQDAADPARLAYRKMWDDFYQIPSTAYTDLTQQKLSPCTGRRVLTSRWARVRGAGFDNATLQRRLLLTADVVLLEADARARERGASAFVNVIGAGLGIWKHSIHQIDVFVLAVLERVSTLLGAGQLPHVSDVNFAYIEPKKDVLELFRPSKDGNGNVRKLFLKNDLHPKGGINVQLESREPSAKLTGEHAGKLLVLTYPWDSNALPGNEFWMGKLSSSGDSAAACATQVTELHNAHINPRVRGAGARVAGEGLRALHHYAAAVAADAEG